MTGTQSAMPSAFLVRPADLASAQDEAHAIYEFYMQNPDEMLRERGFPQILSAVESGLYWIAEADGRWVGVCGYFQYADGDYGEIGGVRVIKQRCGLQRVLMAACTWHAYTYSPPERAMFSIINKINTTSRNNLLACGFAAKADNTLLKKIDYRDFSSKTKELYKLDDAGIAISVFQAARERRMANCEGCQVPLEICFP